MQELFANHIIESPKIGNVVIEEVDKCDGEARANNRKGKLIFFYEWEITLKWKGENMILKMSETLLMMLLQVMLMAAIKRLLARLRSLTCPRSMMTWRMSMLILP